MSNTKQKIWPSCQTAAQLKFVLDLLKQELQNDDEIEVEDIDPR